MSGVGSQGKTQVITIILALLVTGAVLSWYMTDEQLREADLAWRQAVADQNGLERNVSRVKSLLAQKNSMPVDEINEGNTMAFIESQAKRSGIGVPDKMTPSPLAIIDKKEGISELKIHVVKREVRLADGIRFMYNLESGGLGLKIVQISLKPNLGKKQDTWSLDCRVSCFLQTGP